MVDSHYTENKHSFLTLFHFVLRKETNLYADRYLTYNIREFQFFYLEYAIARPIYYPPFYSKCAYKFDFLLYTAKKNLAKFSLLTFILRGVNSFTSFMADIAIAGS